VTALGLTVVEGYGLVRKPSPEAVSFADALQRRDLSVAEAYAFIRAGQDPNEPIRVQDSVLTAGRSVRVAPLLLAVASHNEEAVKMLLSFGVRVDTAPNNLTACLANQLGDKNIANVIVRMGGRTLETCPERVTDSEAPLLPRVD
jgi:hypothetical protein